MAKKLQARQLAYAAGHALLRRYFGKYNPARDKNGVDSMGFSQLVCTLRDAFAYLITNGEDYNTIRAISLSVVEHYGVQRNSDEWHRLRNCVVGILNDALGVGKDEG